MTQYKCNSSDYIVYIDYTSSSKYILYNRPENTDNYRYNNINNMDSVYMGNNLSCSACSDKYLLKR